MGHDLWYSRHRLSTRNDALQTAVGSLDLVLHQLCAGTGHVSPPWTLLVRAPTEAVAYTWTALQWGECSVTCGTGVVSERGPHIFFFTLDAIIVVGS